jgi:hypothetical protein
MSKLNVGAEFQLHSTTFQVVGIDDYKLQNSSGGQRDWVSYTLLSAGGERTWISYGVADSFFTRWAEITLTEYQQLAKNATVDLNLTGIARITFAGDRGHSTPDAELVWSRTDSEAPEFSLIERFLTVDADGVRGLQPYFQTGTILREFAVN